MPATSYNFFGLLFGPTRFFWRSAEEGRSDKKYPAFRRMNHRKMEAQYAEAKEELIGELKEKTTTITIKDFTPAGVRAEYNQLGEITGKINARHIETVTALFKPDGTVEYEGRGVSTTSDGETFLETSKGKGRTETPSKISFEGETSYQTASKKLAWLNGVKGRHEGTYNSDTGEASIKLYGKR